MKRHIASGLIATVAACWISVWTLGAFGQTPLASKEKEVASPAHASPAGDKDLPKENLRDEAGSLLHQLDLHGVWTENTATDWMVLLGAILAGLVAGNIAAAVLGWIARRLSTRQRLLRSRVFEDAMGPAKLAVLAAGLAIGFAALKGVSEPLQEFAARTLLLIYSIAVFWYIFNLVGIVDIVLRRMIAKTDSSLDEQVVPLIRKSLRIFLVVVGVLFVVDSVFHQDIGAWLAGLGIAGLAVSLAAQDSLKNLFGSITILFDRPFQVGERIVYAGYDGVIEEIGFRSTKVRTLTGHLVTIPNSRIVNDPVENIGRRPFIRRMMDVTITYDTPREKIEQAVQILQDILDEEGIREPIHPAIDDNEYPPRVYFKDYSADSLDLQVIYWFSPPAYWDYMDHAQRLNLRIFEEFEKAGIEFAFPTQTLYLAGDSKRELAVQMLGKDM